ncbi:MAG: peptide transporter permease [Myxococcales bacterium]|nr:peptide transporter permease [Myxococcales bacterium]
MRVSLFPYHVRLAAKSLRRDPGVTLVMLLALALGDGVWAMSAAEQLRFDGHDVALPPTLYQVELLRPRDATSVFVDGAAANPYLAPRAILSRTKQSYPEMQRLAASEAPARLSPGIRAEVLVRGPTGDADVRVARFTTSAFFSMFERPFAVGGPWRRADDAGGAGVVVLGHATGRKLFPAGDGLGQTVSIEGRPHRVVGVLAGYQPLNAPWQLLIFGGFEDALFLPLGDFEPMGVWPDEALYRTPPEAPGRAALLRSDALFVVSWVDLPTPTHVEAYRRDLDRLVGPGRYVLRSLAEWRRAFPMPTTQLSFFSFLAVIVLLGGIFTLARFLLTKGLTRGPELGVYRALGAPRASIFARTWAEGMLLAVPAALFGPVMALPTTYIFNRFVHIVDMPLEGSLSGVAIGVLTPIAACALGLLYPAWRLSRVRPTVYLGMS